MAIITKEYQVDGSTLVKKDFDLEIGRLKLTGDEQVDYILGVLFECGDKIEIADSHYLYKLPFVFRSTRKYTMGGYISDGRHYNLPEFERLVIEDSLFNISQNCFFPELLVYAFPIPFKAQQIVNKLSSIITPQKNKKDGSGIMSLYVLSPSPYLGIQPSQNQVSQIQQADPSLIALVKCGYNEYVFRLCVWDLTLDGLNLH